MSVDHCSLVGINSEVGRLKEDIRSAFARLRNAINSREICLMDQVDSIREASTSTLIGQQMAAARLNARLGESAKYLRFSEEQKNDESIEYVTGVINQLKRKANNNEAQTENPLTRVKFVRDDYTVRNAVLSYGKLETDVNCGGNNGTPDSSCSNSFELVHEKDGTDPPPKCDKELSCHSALCFKKVPVKDVEDMDIEWERSVDFDDSDAESFDLWDYCKADCLALSECVCEIPCMRLPTRERRGKSECSFHASQSEPSSVEAHASSVSESMVLSSAGHQGHEMPLSSQVNNTVVSPKKILPGTECIDHLHIKLQEILDGTSAVKSYATEPDKYVNDAEKPTGYTGEFAPIDCLSKKIQDIFNQPDTPEFSGKYQPKEDCYSRAKSVDPPSLSIIGDLNARLQSIINGSTYSEMELCGSKESSIDVTEKRDLPKSCPVQEKDGFLEVLQFKLQGMMDNEIATHKTAYDVSEIPTRVKEDHVVGLHERIVHILANGIPTSDEDSGLSSQENADPVSSLSSRIESLMSD